MLVIYMTWTKKIEANFYNYKLQFRCYLEYAMKTKRCPKFPGIHIMRNRIAKET